MVIHSYDTFVPIFTLYIQSRPTNGTFQFISQHCAEEYNAILASKKQYEDFATQFLFKSNHFTAFGWYQ